MVEITEITVPSDNGDDKEGQQQSRKVTFSCETSFKAPTSKSRRNSSSFIPKSILKSPIPSKKRLPSMPLKNVTNVPTKDETFIYSSASKPSKTPFMPSENVSTNELQSEALNPFRVRTSPAPCQTTSPRPLRKKAFESKLPHGQEGTPKAELSPKDETYILASPVDAKPLKNVASDDLQPMRPSTPVNPSPASPRLLRRKTSESKQSNGQEATSKTEVSPKNETYILTSPVVAKPLENVASDDLPDKPGLSWTPINNETQLLASPTTHLSSTPVSSEFEAENLNETYIISSPKPGVRLRQSVLFSKTHICDHPMITNGTCMICEIPIIDGKKKRESMEDYNESLEKLSLLSTLRTAISNGQEASPKAEVPLKDTTASPMPLLASQKAAVDNLPIKSPLPLASTNVSSEASSTRNSALFCKHRIVNSNGQCIRCYIQVSQPKPLRSSSFRRKFERKPDSSLQNATTDTDLSPKLNQFSTTTFLKDKRRDIFASPRSQCKHRLINSNGQCIRCDTDLSSK